jgi:hypothetical protein
MGQRGTVTMRLKLQEGFGGAVISLLDRFFNPTDETGEMEAIFTLPIQPDGRVSLACKLTIGEWHTLLFEWDLSKRTCVVQMDGTPTLYLKPNYRDAPGINYVRIRSTAEAVDDAGLLIDSVSADGEGAQE